jgi:single stranded DNA-binding protein
LDYQHIVVFLIGNATQDAQVKQAKEGGQSYGDFRLAVRNRQGETMYYPIRCFGRLAERISSIKKGTKLFVEGELEINSYTSEEGHKQMSYRVVAETYRILDRRISTTKSEVVDKT